MNEPEAIAERLLDPILTAPRSGQRKLVALAGPPASGKSTLAEVLADKLNEAGCQTQVVPMDGFHLDNAILTQRGLLDRKGAPETFDVEGLLRLIGALPDAPSVIFPVFDRDRDIAIAGAGLLPETCDTVIVEGNYLLFDAPGWRELRRFWDFSISLNVDLSTLRQRLIDRWLHHGLPHSEAVARAEGNDLENARLVAAASLKADKTIT
ncbi:MULTISPECIES: nucleoside/nucleotide kinase family protein [Phaeobacter]|uniref:nucleoside/nucleotide kinase family protein n=1 Tax=Phaeobacter TaxID=302485 RepID=UPI00237F56F2|nr:nucleoside/nucleotide kinase family protein [Phaeobacter gallaeciensis]MDE4190326.1 nucleoside/nucleotide kinase family protein [Phaeobacter gallaeciensis]MDE4198181.1 nucleoside/nucleotide kinase family protein [Phaeobacter gallaeciensis]MDE4202324.1 nucleoside/nucleotide kinase family protein [Phaeobacter gallaeciensis]MDE4206377.1 nucleoside/nucleotide kinase family protein [Phaeobacter gallaeciensis]MDE4214745.1 nucleoside/nucleotide kinase family protein [Phaeobacter gallaeciensis]